ncbi:MAG: pyrimidine 5'-nucleotidase [Anaerolineales bacterium]|nr:pyrimidine 5'-nucleotidase [Anaerolineales bacterium]
MGRYCTLFFDLDDTLYPRSSGLWNAIGERINSFMIDRLEIPEENVSPIRDEYLRTYGTTLNGLVANYQIDPFEYLTFVHDVQIEDYLHPDPVMQRMLASLHPSRIIFTNASVSYAMRVLKRLGVDPYIDQIIDIIALDFHNKPLPQAYERALDLAQESDPKACMLIDDRVDNLLPAAALGMTTVLVGDRGGHPGVDFHIERITELLDKVPGINQNPDFRNEDAS